METTAEKMLAFDKPFVPSQNQKKAMAEVNAKSRDTGWYMRPQDIVVVDDMNIRFHTDEWLAGVESLANDMVVEGFYDHKPLSVIVAAKEGGNVIYLHEGHRRLRAVLLAIERGGNIDMVPVVPAKRGMSPVESLVQMIKSNEGVPFTTLELAIGCARLEKFGQTPAQIGAVVHRDERYVNDLLMLASCGKKFHDLILANTVSASTVMEALKKHKDKAWDVLNGAVGAAVVADGSQAPKGRKTAAVKGSDLESEEDALKKRAAKNGYRLYKKVVAMIESLKIGAPDKELEKILFAIEEA